MARQKTAATLKKIRPGIECWIRLDRVADNGNPEDGSDDPRLDRSGRGLAFDRRHRWIVAGVSSRDATYECAG